VGDADGDAVYRLPVRDTLLPSAPAPLFARPGLDNVVRLAPPDLGYSFSRGRPVSSLIAGT